MTIVTVQWSDLPAAIPMRSVRWLDERQFCPVFLDRVHFGIVPEHGQLVRCKSWAAGACTRVGSKTLCALLDPSPELWRKAEDWRIQGDGSILYDPRHETVAHRLVFSPVYEMRRTEIAREMLSSIINAVAAP